MQIPVASLAPNSDGFYVQFIFAPRAHTKTSWGNLKQIGNTSFKHPSSRPHLLYGAPMTPLSHGIPPAIGTIRHKAADMLPKSSFYPKLFIISAVFLYFRYSILWCLGANALIFIYVLWRTFRIKPWNITQKRNSKRKFNFLAKEPWLGETSSLRVDRNQIDQNVIPESIAISNSLSKLIDLILQEFVDLWFTRVSANTLFQDSIRLELKHVFGGLAQRLGTVDIPTLLVHKIIPILTDHYANFTADPHAYDTLYSIESKLNVARKIYKERLHEGVSLDVPGAGVQSKEKAFLRKRVMRILPYLLTSQERSNSIVSKLLTEILACTVLTNVFGVLSEGDFFNQMIVKLVGANLQHRNQVKRLRAALQQHTAQSPDHTITITEATTLPRLRSPISQDSVTAWTVHISKCNSEDERRRLRGMLDREQGSLDTRDETYEHDRAVIMQMISMTDEPSRPSPKFERLEAVLAEPKHAAVFREFLRGTKHESEIDLWQDIELMRAPLESTDATEIPLFLEFSNKDDIVRIYEKYFLSTCFEIGEEIRRAVSQYVRETSLRDATLYQQARKALFQLQRELFLHMKFRHFSKFQNSSRFGDLESTLPRKQNRRVVSTAYSKANPNESIGGVERDTMNPNLNLIEAHSVSPVVVKAVESAFEKIMNSSSLELERKFLNVNAFEEAESPQTLHHKPSYTSLFGDSGGSLSNSTFGSQKNSLNRLSALFEGSEVESDAASVLSESLDSDDSESRNMSNLELLLAAPGDLSLAEKIDVLDHEIENLSEQNEILLSLLKKAELTNNIAELKILKRSNASLEKEIHSKELQKQQYIVQENDNSLYGKSKVRIQSCMFGKDQNLTYVMYVIEVQKYSSEDPNEIVAGWIVARRYSQFFKLNEYLKKRYTGVTEIKFPKKNMRYLKFQKDQEIEIRKPLLEKYLQDLLMLPDVCSDSAFRSFLSSENFHFGKTPTDEKKKNDSIFNRFYQDIPDATKDAAENLSKEAPHVKRNEEMLLNIREMERELKQFDENQRDEAEKVAFVRPISDLLLTVFDLSKSNWLRGRALLVILQQVLGSTIERTLTTQIDNNLKQESKIVELLSSLEGLIFPNGKFRESPELRTKAERMDTRKEAFTIMRLFMSETCSKIFGVRNTNYACRNLLEMLQNDYLNKHLILEVLDALLLALFPELNSLSDEFA